MSKYIYILVVLLFLLMIKLVILVVRDLENQRRFQEFIVAYNKSYSKEKSVIEYHQRFQQFEKAIEEIDRLNSQRKHEHSAIYGITEFADLSNNEFSKRMLSKRWNRMRAKAKAIILDKIHILRQLRDAALDRLPKKVNWMDRGVVSGIRNQGICGACWAHSVIETIESMLAIVRNETVRELSVQQMVDCAVNNHGCYGGDTCNLLQWLVVKDVPIVPMSLYPTTNSQSQCEMVARGQSFKENITVKSFTCESMVHQEHRMLEYLAKIGPITVGVNAHTWQYYLGGVIQHNCDGDPYALNHAVQIVGYDRSGEVPFYIVRNSWGETFGDHGFAKIQIGSNLCGIATQVSTILV